MVPEGAECTGSVEARQRRVLFGPERISRGVIGPRQRSRHDGRSDRADGSSPEGEREEIDNFPGGSAAVCSLASD